MRSSMLPHKVERMMFLRLNRLVIPEVKALHNAVEANKAAAALLLLLSGCRSQDMLRVFILLYVSIEEGGGGAIS